MNPRESNFIFKGIKEYLQKPDCKPWEKSRLLNSLAMLQSERLNILIVRIVGLDISKLVNQLLIKYNTKPNNDSIVSSKVYQSDYLWIWDLPGLGSIETNYTDLASYILSCVNNPTHVRSNMFIILILLDSRRCGITYEQKFIETLRESYKDYADHLERHFIIALNESTCKPDTLQNLTEEYRNMICSNLHFCPEIVSLESNDQYLAIKRKLLIRASALYHKPPYK